MGGYIGARAGTLSTTVANVQDVTATDTTPEVTIINNTHEDTDGGREGKVIFKGQQSGGEESTLAEIQGSHDGTADDEKGDLIFKTNDGSDGVSPTERLRIDSDGSIITATLGTDNVHLGEGAGAAIVSGGNNNVAIGKNAGAAITTGDKNTALGESALSSNTTTNGQTAVGYQALKVSTGANNAALGMDAGVANTTGAQNTFVGRDAGYSNVDGSQNTALGNAALYSTTSGTDNTVVGMSAGYSNTTNSFNSYLGDHAGYNSTGEKNVFLGHASGEAMTTGSKNTIIGRYDGNQGSVDIRTGNNHIVLSDGDGNPRIVVDNDGDVFIGGSYNNNVRNGNAQLQLYSNGDGEALITATTDLSLGGHVHRSLDGGTGTHYIHYYENSNGTNVGKITHNNSTTSYATTSDYRLKENVVDLTGAITRIKQLEPKRFNFIADADNTVDGFIAHEAATVVPEAVDGTHNEIEIWKENGELPDGVSVGDNKLDADGNTIPKYQGIDQSKIVPLLTAALQEAIAKIETLETKVAALEGE